MPRVGSNQRSQRTRVYRSRIIESARVHWGDVSLRAHLPRFAEDLEPDLHIAIGKAGGRGIAMDLSTLSVAEIDALRDVFDKSFDYARPIAAARDERAAATIDEVVEPHPRTFRARPLRRSSVFPGVTRVRENVVEWLLPDPKEDRARYEPFPGIPE